MFIFAHSELFRKGMIGEAMVEVKIGNQKGYVSTPDLAKHVIEQLALAGLKASSSKSNLHFLVGWLSAWSSMPCQARH